MRFVLLFSFVSHIAFAFTAAPTTRVFTLRGMTCSACVKAVQAKVCGLPEVAKCTVEINKLTLEGTTPEATVRDAVASTQSYQVVKVATVVETGKTAAKKSK